MDRGSSWLAAMALAVLAVVLAPVNIWLSTNVQAEGQAMNQRRGFIAQTAQLTRVAEVTATTLARYAVRDNDAPIRALLTRAGISIQTSPAAPAPVPAPGPAAAVPAVPPSPSAPPPPASSLLPAPPAATARPR